MLYMTTSRKDIDPADYGIKVLEHVEGMGHHHFMIEVGDAEQIFELEKAGIEIGVIHDEEAALRYLRDHPRATKTKRRFFPGVRIRH